MQKNNNISWKIHTFISILLDDFMYKNKHIINNTSVDENKLKHCHKFLCMLFIFIKIKHVMLISQNVELLF
jgi:hypothetical protein